MNLIDKITAKIATMLVAKAEYGTIVQAYYEAKGIDWERQSVSMNAKEIKDWKLALMTATDPDYPRRGALMRFYQNMKTDLHLLSCLDGRIMPVQCAPFKLTDKNGDEDTEAKKLLERPWYLELVSLVVGYQFQGTTLIEMFELNDKMELKEVKEIPQSNFIPQKGIVLKKEWDQEGTSYKKGKYANYYIQIGGDWVLGKLNQAAIIVLAKKLGLGSWLSYIEKYGVPPLFAITERMDETRRDELFEMLENFRMNHFAVLQGSEKIETPDGYNVDAHNTFKSLIVDIGNAELSKFFLGGTGTVDEKSFVGSAQIHADLLKLRNQVDKLLFKFYFNEEIKPRLVKLSPVYAAFENLTFEWDESETMTVKEIIDSVQKLSAYYDFDVEELERTTGLPFTGLKNTTPTMPPGLDDEKKKPELTKALKFPPAKSNFNVNGRFIYAHTWDAAAERIAKAIEDGTLKPSDLDRDFVLKTYAGLNKAAAAGYGSGYYSDKIGRKLREHILKFSGAKTHKILSDITAAEKAGLKGDNLTEEAKKITNIQMVNWLVTEQRDTARSAQIAAEWQEFERDRDIYPNLKYRTMMDEDVRDSHAANEGIIKPIDEWTEAPPFGYNCRCWLEQTYEPPTGGELSNVNPTFANNPGRNGEIYSPAHSYFQIPKSFAAAVMQNTELMKQFLPYTQSVKSGKHTIFINDFADLSDLAENVTAAKKVAPVLDKNIYIRHHFDGGKAPGHKNPEFGIGTVNKLGDLKTYDGNSKFENFLKNAMKSANGQNAQTLIVDISKGNYSKTDLQRVLKGGVKNRNKNILRIVIIKGKDVYQITRKQLLKGDFSSLE